jgi:hypothetical protein
MLRFVRGLIVFFTAISGFFALGGARNVVIEIMDDRKQDSSISPLIYGFGSYLREDRDSSNTWELRPTAFRFGGNSSERFNFKTNSWNTGKDWFFSNQSSRFPNVIDKFMGENEKQTITSAMTVPMMGWIAKDGKGGSFPVTSFANQESSDNGLGNGRKSNGEEFTANPDMANIPLSDEYLTDWVRYLKPRFGKREHYYIVGNEPMLWHEQHRDVHPERATYDEVLAKFLRVARIVRREDPNAIISGPSLWGWLATQQSAFDERGPWNKMQKFKDRDQHGGKPFLVWFVGEVAKVETKEGIRLLDVIDVHYYPEGKDLRRGQDKTVTVRDARLSSTRSLWDSSWKDQSWIDARIEFFNLLQATASSVSPTRKVAIGEYNFRGEQDITGGLVQAEVLGILAWKKIYAAFYWTIPPQGSFAAAGFATFRNYDGLQASFGERFLENSIGVSADYSVFTSRRNSDQKIVAVVINKSQKDSLTLKWEMSANRTTKVLRCFVLDENGGPTLRLTPNEKCGALAPLSLHVVELDG